MDRIKKFIKANRNRPFSGMTYLMYIFSMRLYRNLKQDGCKHVLFMSREGEFFKRIFDCYQQMYIKPEKRIATYYFYVSRRATIVPSVHEISREAFAEIYKNYPNLSIKTFLKNLGLSEDEDLINEISSFANIDKEIIGFSKSPEFNRLLKNKSFIEKCGSLSKNQRELFIKCLDDMDINYMDEGLFLVDVGYSGTSQNNVYKIFNGEVEINGYYMFLSGNTGNAGNNKKGILYDKNTGEKKDAFAYNSGVIEVLTLASHGSVTGYELRSGEVFPTFESIQAEMDAYENVVKPIQKNILNIFIALCGSIDGCEENEKRYYRLFEREYKKFIFKPSAIEIEEYLKIPVIDNFAMYKEYVANDTQQRHGWCSLKSGCQIIKTKGQCIKQQGTNWIAAALYEMDMRILNSILYCFSDFANWIFTYMNESAIRRRKELSEITWGGVILNYPSSFLYYSGIPSKEVCAA